MHNFPYLLAVILALPVILAVLFGVFSDYGKDDEDVEKRQGWSSSVDEDDHDSNGIFYHEFWVIMDLWWQAISSTMVISTAPIIILYFVPIKGNTNDYQPFLKLLLSFASGGLLGDAFLHLIPQALNLQDKSVPLDKKQSRVDDPSQTTVVGLWVLMGIVIFLAVEKCVLHAKRIRDDANILLAVNDSDNDRNDELQSDDETNSDESDHVIADKLGSLKQKFYCRRMLWKRKKRTEKTGIKVSGYLNLVADFTHNFTDGLAIGAAFLGGHTLGAVTTATVLLHELPHEIGDFAILLRSGCSKRKAMLLQLSTATGALAGCVLGLLIGNLGESTASWILPFTAGGFIYIATVSVIPELLQDSDPKQTVGEIFAMLLGIELMVVILVLE